MPAPSHASSAYHAGNGPERPVGRQNAARLEVKAIGHAPGMLELLGLVLGTLQVACRGRDFQRQKSRQPCRCQRTTVPGRTSVVPLDAVVDELALLGHLHAGGGGAGAQVRHLALDGPRLGLAVGRDASGEGRVDHHSSLPVGAGPRSGRAGRGPRCTGPLVAGTSRAEARSTLARASRSGSNTTRTTNLAAASPSRILRFSLRNASRDPAREHKRTAGEPQPPSAGVNAQPVPPEDDREPEPGPGACAIVQVVRAIWRLWQECLPVPIPDVVPAAPAAA